MRETIQCPYHAWTYGLDGSLRSAPRSDREPGFDKTSLGLVPVAVDTWGPFVFVNPDRRSGAARRRRSASCPSCSAAGGVDVDSLRFHARVEADEYACNWKVCVENFLECYHCAVAHPTLAKAIDVSQDAYALEMRGRLASQFGPPRNGGGGVYDAVGEVERGQFHLLFPGTVVNVDARASRTSRSGRSSRAARSARTASSTTSSAPTSTRRGSRTTWRSTSRSAPRIERSSRASSAESRAAASRPGR